MSNHTPGAQRRTTRIKFRIKSRAIALCLLSLIACKDEKRERCLQRGGLYVVTGQTLIPTYYGKGGSFSGFQTVLKYSCIKGSILPDTTP